MLRSVRLARVGLLLFICIGLISVQFFVQKQAPQQAMPVSAEVRAAATDLCSAEPDLILNDGENTYDGTDITIANCTFTINGTHSFGAVVIGDGSGVFDSVLNHSETTSGTVYSINITATSFTIQSDGRIDTNARGFLGGTTAPSGQGYTTGNTTTGGSTGGAGGSNGGRGGTSTNGSPALAYGNVTDPTEPGGGGGGWDSNGAFIGGDGGGLVRITTSGTFTLNGDIRANGGNSPSVGAGGAGGSVYINALILAGSGTINANGGNSANSGNVEGGGGGGRVAIYYTSDSATWTVNTNGGTGSTGGLNGGAGTYYRKAASQTNGDVIVDNNNVITYDESTPLPATPTIFDNVTIREEGRVVSFFGLTDVTGTMLIDDGWYSMGTNNVQLEVQHLTLQNTANLTHSETTTAARYNIDILATGNISIDATSTVNVNARGYKGGTTAPSGQAYSTGNALTYGSTGGTGGSYGGYGGTSINGSAGKTYGDVTNPIEQGAGGGGWDSNGTHIGGDGGGLIRLTTNGTFTNNGTISANGGSGSGGAGAGGAGGGVFINTSIFAGNGTVTANGGVTANSGNVEGGGGGGRVAIYMVSNTYAGTVTAYGAVGTTGGGRGGAGTIYRKLTSQTYGDIEVNNNGTTTDWRTPTPFRIHERISTGLTATVLTDTSSTFVADSLVGFLLNPNRNQMTSFTITANTANTITVTGDMTTVAVIGNAYAIARPQFDNMTLAGNAYVAFDDFPLILTGTLTLSGSAILTHEDIEATHLSRLEVSSSSVDVGAGTRIDVSFRGFRGGTTAASGQAYTTGNVLTGGSTGGAGGSHGGRGGTSTNGSPALAHGSVTDPIEPGGGGGGWDSNPSLVGGDGGGLARLTASGTFTLTGEVRANGGVGSGAGAGGAGGGLYINASTITGTGTINMNGGNSANSGNVEGGGGGGRVAIYYTSDTSTWTVNVNGGSGSTGGLNGGAGTIYRKAASQTNGDLIVDNNNVATYDESTPLPATPIIFDNITVREEGRVVSFFGVTDVTGTMLIDDGWYSMGTNNVQLEVQTLTLQNTANLTHSETTTAARYNIDIYATGSISIDATSTVNVNARGYKGGTTAPSGQAYSTGNALTYGSTGGTGGSYGGYGGTSINGSAGKTYGDVTNPVEQGAGGGGWDSNGSWIGGDGGGLVRLAAVGVMTLNGSITSNGGNSPSIGAGGSGGGVYINVGTLTGSGSITVTGGNSANSGNVEGGGGGGRVAIYAGANTYSGTTTAYGGTGSSGGGRGGAGTIFRKLTSQSYGDIEVNNNGTTADWRTPTPFRIHERISTGVTSTVLTDTSSTFTPDALVGFLLNPNRNQMTTFTITGNTTNTITVTGDMTTVAGVGNAYAIARPQFDNMTLAGNAYVSFDDFPLILTGTLTLSNSAILTHEDVEAGHLSHLAVTLNHLTVNSGTSISSTGRGFRGGTTAASGQAYSIGNVLTYGSTGGAGGSYGGQGGDSINGDQGIPFGDFRDPQYHGGGGGGWDSNGAWIGGDGGGLIRFTASGTVTIDGSIVANGTNSPSVGGGGAGGGIYISTSVLAGSGSVTANGGNGASSGNVEGGGSGGRIAVLYASTSYAGTVSAIGGVGFTSGDRGAAGTQYLWDTDLSEGNLTVNNNSNSSPRFTPLFVTQPAGLPTTHTVRDLYVINIGRLLIDTPCSGTPALTVTGTISQSGSGIIQNNQPGTCTTSFSAMNIVSALANGAVGVAYNEQVNSGGGYAPKTHVCLSGLGGSIVACNTVMPAGLTMDSAGLVTGTPTIAGDYTFAIRVTDSNPGGAQQDEETMSITIGNTPTAPTSLFSNATNAQSCCSSPVVDASPVFSAIFNDPDIGNTSTKYRIQVAADAGFTSLMWESGENGLAMTSCVAGDRCADIAYAGSSLSLGGVTYYWRIKFWDQTDLQSPFSASATFTTSTAPTAPTSLFSNDSNAQSGLTNPIGVLAAFPVFSAVFNDPDISDTASKYRVQVSTTNDFSALVWDSGSGGTNMATCNEGGRCADIVFGGTALTRNETTYYWRIKFWDAAGVEGAWSQDPTSTNTFKMATAGGSVQVLQQQQLTPQPVPPDAPLAGAVEIVSADTVRFNWIDVSANETGFRVLNPNGNIVADVSGGVTQATVSGLEANALVSGYGVLAYNDIGQSAVDLFDAAVTAAPSVRPVVQQRGGDSVTFVIEPAFTSFAGQTAAQFELIIRSVGGTTRTIMSGFVQSNSYTFQGVSPTDELQIRVITRNQTGLQNEPPIYEDVAQLSRRFQVNLGVFKQGTNTLPRPLSLTDRLSVRMSLTHVGTDPATSVALNMPLPRYITYIEGSLTVDGRSGSDVANEQGTVANQNGVSSTWARMNPGDTHTVSFDLGFDLENLLLLRESDTAMNTNATDAIIAALVQAAANPLISMQASVSFAESDAVYMSPVITIEPDVEGTIEPELPVEEPIEEPLPMEEIPVVIPTQEETAIIEQILQQEFPQPAQPSNQPGAEPTPSTIPTSSPTLQTGETTTSSDAGSFNIDVSGSNSSLGLTGSASVTADQIQFVGTTTEPFTVITLIFNNSITAIVVSDAQGVWQTFVDADRLGIQPGQEARVTIEAVAAKGDLRSERVQVGDVTVSRGRSGDIAAEFDTTVSESAITTAVAEIRKEVVRVVAEQEPVIKTTLTVSAPVVIVSSAPLWGYLPYAPTLVYHLITQAVGLIGRKKKGLAGRFYGVAYDSISKQPLALAIIRIYKVQSILPGAASVGAGAAVDKKLVTTIVTDKQGRYDALLEPGQYTLEVAKPGYLFPSQIVTTSMDADFQHVYDMRSGIVVEGDQVTIPDVPLDPMNAQRQWQLATGGKKIWMAIQRVGDHLAAPILIVGSIISALVVATNPDKPSNWIVAGMYILLLVLQVRFKPKLEKAWGVVYDIATNAVLPLTAIQLIEPSTSKVVTSRLSDYQGRFAFLPEPGTYVIKASKPGFSQVAEVVEAPQTNRQPLHGEISIEKSNQRINGDIAMRQQM